MSELRKLAERSEALVMAALSDKGTLYATLTVVTAALDYARLSMKKAGLESDLAKLEAIVRCEDPAARVLYETAMAYGPALKVTKLVDNAG